MTRLYTVSEANRTLPYVRSIVGEIRERYEAIREKSRMLRTRPETAQADLRGEIKEQARRIEACMGELEALGIELKDHRKGLVDFPAELEGRPIHLCWMHGEDAIAHWHEVHAGFAGRRPIPDDTPLWPRGTRDPSRSKR